MYGNDEWSYGYCEQGTGVFRCPSSKNPMYTYREKIVLGRTDCTIFMVNQIFRELTREWPGHTYDLLSRNCNHFCDVLCDRLGVPKLPGKAHYLVIRVMYMCVGLEGLCDVRVMSIYLNRLGEPFCACWRHSFGSSRNHSDAGGFFLSFGFYGT